MVATSHPDASLVAVDILRQGGTAVDAAIAAAAVLAVVEPAETGIGGDCFALVAPGGRVPPLAFNGSGRAPAGVSAARLRARRLATVPANGADAVTVPGAVDAWVKLHGRFGRRPLARLLEPAIALAEEGYVVQERVALEWERGAARLAGDSEAAAIFLPEGRPPAAGTVMRNPALANTPRRIAAEGRAGFYEGPVAAAMADTLARLGGSHTAADFAACRGDFVEPLAAPNRGRRIWQLPPNTQGPIALLILRLMERWPPAREGFLSFEHVHRLIEAARIAYASRAALLGDAEASGPLLALLADEARLHALAATIDPLAAGTGEIPRGEATDTVYLAVVDGEGTAVSFINSIFHSFGSGICPPGTGVLLQNRGAGFSLEEGHPNALAPGRRPMHTLIPAMVENEGAVEIAVGQRKAQRLHHRVEQVEPEKEHCREEKEPGTHLVGAVDVAPDVGPPRREDHPVEDLVREIEVADTARDADDDRYETLKCRVHGSLPAAPRARPVVFCDGRCPSGRRRGALRGPPPFSCGAAGAYFSASQLAWISEATSSAVAPPA